MSETKKKKTPKKAVAKKKEEAPKKKAPEKAPAKFKTPEEFYKAKNELKAQHLKATPDLWQLPLTNPARAKYEAEKNALKARR